GICDLRLGARGGTWNREGTILFGAFGQPLMRVADTGGVPSPATVIDRARGEFGHGWPVFLPDGRRFVYLASSSEPGQTAIYEGSLDSAAVRRVFAAESRIGRRMANGSRLPRTVSAVSTSSKFAPTAAPPIRSCSVRRRAVSKSLIGRSTGAC